MRLYREHKEMDACSVLTIEGLVLEMLAIVGRMRNVKEQHGPPWFPRAMELLHEDFRTNLKVQDIANEVSVHPFHLSRVFRTVHRQTIGEYVQKLRVSYACKELLKAENDLVTVALAAGFSDQSHFTRVFKSITGITPGAFREIAAPNH
jgi:AraC family transcriptional regulator